MQEINYDKIQNEIHRPQRLCRHCGRCMPIIDGLNLNISEIDSNATRGPMSVWDEYPQECGFTGWMFFEREKQKHLIRKIKEEIHALSFLPSSTVVGKNKTAQEKIKELDEQIFPWEKHGSKNW